jgi:V/A-type H+-transporting ATPase subunit I
LGVLHLERSSGDVSSDKYSRLENNINRLNQCMTVLPQVTEHKAVTTDRDEAEELFNSVIEMEKQSKALDDEMNHIHMQIEILEQWDNINPQDLVDLREKGIDLRLFHVSEKEFIAREDKEGLIILNEKKGYVSLLALNKKIEDLEPWEEVELPELGPNALLSRKEQIEMSLTTLADELEDAAARDSLLYWLLEELQQELQWEEAKLRYQEEDKLAYLQGYVPVDVLEDLQNTAKENKWGLLLQDPNEEDAVPTKLKLGKVSSLLTPVLNLLGITPCYREFDVIFFFHSFFTVFAAMLIGDAGYGSLFLIAVLYFLIKTIVSGKKPGTGLALFMLLSLTTIIWGALNGNWFGSAYAMNIPLLARFRIDAFSGTEADVNDTIMRISFFLGVVQLGLACIQRFIRELPQLKGFAQLGWFGVVVGMYYLVLNQVLGDTSVAYSVIFTIMGIGLALIFLFGYQEKGQNFFIGVLKSFPNLFTLFLDVVGSFANMMSYIRLFAVGLASLKIAQTFNMMAAPLMEGSFSKVGAVGILLAGHTLNIVLALLAVFVHAIRLNILEYSGQLGMEWSGFKYEPFKGSY